MMIKLLLRNSKVLNVKRFSSTPFDYIGLAKTLKIPTKTLPQFLQVMYEKDIELERKGTELVKKEMELHYKKQEALMAQGLMNGRGIMESYLETLRNELQLTRFNAKVICERIQSPDTEENALTRQKLLDAKSLFDSCEVTDIYSIYQIFSEKIHNFWPGSDVQILKEDWMTHQHICVIQKLAHVQGWKTEIVQKVNFDDK